MLRLAPLLFLVFFSLNLLAGPGSTSFNVLDYGAIAGDEQTDHRAVNAAIDAAAAAGGGTVYFPAGEYLSFSIRLKSNVNLYLEAGAILLAANPADFPDQGYDLPDYNVWGDSLQYQDFGHSHWKNSLIWGIGLENVIIEGQGMIDGKGLVKHGSRAPGLGNKAIALKNCRNIAIRDITIFRGGHFGILPTAVDQFTIDNVKIDSNRDGINIDCCRNVSISNCYVNTPNDDAIVLKSSYALGYARTTENVTITGCKVSGFDMGTFLDGTYQTTQTMAPDKGGVTGRIKLGTESNGGFRNIAITNCTFTHCRGLAIESVDGGIIENVVVSNLVMNDLVNSPFYIRLGSRMRGPEGVPVGTLKGISISNVTITGVPPRYAALIMGIPGHPVCDVDFNNIKMKVQGGAPASQAQLEVPELETGYPDPRMYGDIPAWAFFVRHAENIDFNNVEAEFEEDDGRPAYVLDDVANARFFDIEADKSNTSGLMQLVNSSDITIKWFKGLEDQFLMQSGEKLRK
ncbi:rhamnogalacturonidase [Roseimarinus sediminis]|uniref:rhamnogalacturonidase n=1 Tax=Roseimarinus sediminis TaxID=1610899 RepID=UPI003D218860